MVLIFPESNSDIISALLELDVSPEMTPKDSPKIANWLRTFPSWSSSSQNIISFESLPSRFKYNKISYTSLYFADAFFTILALA
jgi:hypothetical protein